MNYFKEEVIAGYNRHIVRDKAFSVSRLMHKRSG